MVGQKKLKFPNLTNSVTKWMTAMVQCNIVRRQPMKTELSKGKYGYVDPNGTYREVEYNADENGYHVKILSNEPGITNQNSADVVYVVKGSPSA
ncbi:hypothetical protein CEXT_620181 [Caerostris extrusa]|uniref:Cuticle protein n=1 Tax=Caerostris extrusa TaxID=172846 RepID=A0AAV4NV88_CAEEX|nr:hypothetical protein CEXT_620181 [Caerostris extrusa]